LNGLEEDDPSVLDIDDVEDLGRSVSLMVPAVINPDDGWFLHFIAIFSGDLPGEGEDCWDDQD
jgi:hypothetical protein